MILEVQHNLPCYVLLDTDLSFILKTLTGLGIDFLYYVSKGTCFLLKTPQQRFYCSGQLPRPCPYDLQDIEPRLLPTVRNLHLQEKF